MGHILRRHAGLLGLGMTLVIPSCADDGSPVGTSRRAITARCEADVAGSGVLDVETDYLPHVVACENGAASGEALKAQAVAARSYLYYKLEVDGVISDGQGDQVYTCANPPLPQHEEAVRQTAGEVLRYQGIQVAAFYVAGSLQRPPDCTAGSDDPTATERYVTYNEGRAGDEVEQTSLGFISPTNYANRGCMSQNGADCLSDMATDYQTILRYYYGRDIGIEIATGPCVDGTAGVDAGEGPPNDDDGTGSGGCGCQGSGRSGAGGTALLLAVAAIAAHRRRRSPL